MGCSELSLKIENPEVPGDPSAVLATIDGVTMQIPGMFADSGDSPVLGATALEILGLAVHPIEKRLVPRDLPALAVRATP